MTNNLKMLDNHHHRRDNDNDAAIVATGGGDGSVVVGVDDDELLSSNDVFLNHNHHHNNDNNLQHHLQAFANGFGGSSDDGSSGGNDNDHHHQPKKSSSKTKFFSKIKVKSKSSSEIDLDNSKTITTNHIRDFVVGPRFVCSPLMFFMSNQNQNNNNLYFHHHHNNYGSGSRRSRFKKILMLGSHSSNSSNNNNNNNNGKIFDSPEKLFTSSNDFLSSNHHNNNNDSGVGGNVVVDDSTSDIESELNLLHLDANSMLSLNVLSNNNNNSGKLSSNSINNSTTPLRKRLTKSYYVSSRSQSIEVNFDQSSTYIDDDDDEDDEILKRKYNNNKKNDQNLLLSSRPVRVIKPMAIHPSRMDNYDPPRPSTSVGIQSIDTTSSNFTVQEPSSKHSSAFHQVYSSSTNQNRHFRSNSLNNEASLNNSVSPTTTTTTSSNPYSNPISMESIDQIVAVNEGISTAISNISRTSNWIVEDNSLHHQQQPPPPSSVQSDRSDLVDEPIHMTLEEVRRIAFGSPERFSGSVSLSSSSSCRTSCSKNNNLIMNNRTTAASKPILIQSSNRNGLQNAKTKIKNLFDNFLTKTTPCIGTNNNDSCVGTNNDNISDSGATNSQQFNAQQQQQEVIRPNSSNNSNSNSSPVMNHIRDLFWNHHSNHSNNHHQDGQHQPNWLFSNGTGKKRQKDNNNKKSDRRRQRTMDNGNNNDNNVNCSPFIRRALPPVPTEHIGDRLNSQLIAAEAESPPSNIDLNNNNNDNNNLHGSLRFGRSSAGRYQSLERVNQQQFRSMSEYERKKYLDYVSSIERVKNCGWYWGPISGEMAEKLLDNEPCGSFLVRDSSDEHYIFSLSFKLDGMVRHVRIEQEQGNFSFGSLKKFRSSTIVDFIESAMEHSRSGQFLFFLRLGPELGPIRVQLLHPVSRFKRVQSLQHICRFVILQYVRRDQIHELALPEYLRHYLDTPYYYSEELAQMQREAEEEQQERRWNEMMRQKQQQQQEQKISELSLKRIENFGEEKKVEIRRSDTDKVDSANQSEEIGNLDQQHEDEDDELL